MKSPEVPHNESERLRALSSYGIVDTVPDASFDGLAALAAHMLDVPIALVSIVDETRQWFKARHGLAAPETSRAISFCGHVVVGEEMLVVPDALLDARFVDNPLVTGEPNVRFYAGSPLRTPDGFVLGTLCAIDRRPRQFSPKEREVLALLGGQVVDQLERHRQVRFLAEQRAALSAGEARLRAVLDTMVEGVVVQDRSGAISTCNAAAERILGLTADQMMGRTSIDPRWRSVRADGSVFPGETHPAMETLRTGKPATHVTMGVHKPDGALTWISINSRMLALVDDGAAEAVLTTFHDVTDRFAAEAALAAERAFLTTLLHNLPGSFILVLDGDGCIERSFGLDKIRDGSFGEVSGLTLSAFAIAGRRAEFEGATVRALAGEDVALTSALDALHLEFVLVPLVDERNQRRRVLAIGTDVTERNLLRDRLARHGRLVTTGTLAAGVGHEINNPLSYIMVNVDLAIEELRAIGGGSPSGRIFDLVEALGEAREGAERIRKIVRGLRTFAREETVPVPTEVGAAVELSVNMSMHELRLKATVSVEFTPTPLVLADESRLSQVLVNLLVNAGQAFVTADPDRNRVTIRTGVAADGRVFIEVSDNGPGISPEALPRVFDPFFTTKAVGVGTGLGLSISHNLIVALGGELLVDTTVGEGTTFRALLPVCAPVDADPRRRSVRADAVRGRVLIVDDEPNVAAVMVRVLKAEHEIVSTTDPREALRQLDENAEFDVIFCDLMMPQMSGIQLYSEVRKRHPALIERIVFVTGGTLADPIWRDFLNTVPNERLEKPFEPSHLRELARRYVLRRSSAL